MLQMWVIYLCLFLCVYSEAEEQYIRLSMRLRDSISNTVDCIVDSPKKIWKEGPDTFIYVENVKNVLSHESSCQGKNDDQTLKLANFCADHGYNWKAQVLDVTSGNFRCDIDMTLYNQNDSRPIYCYFNIEVKYVITLNAYANGKLLDNNVKDLPRGVVDSTVNYYFSPNELVNIKCAKPPDVYGSLQLINDADLKNISVAEQIDSLQYQMILTDTDHGSYVDCKFTDTSRSETVLRIYMMLDTDGRKDLIEINGFNVRPQNDTFVYLYSGILPTVTCDGNSTEVGMTNSGYAKAVCNIKDVSTTLQFHRNITCEGVFNNHRYYNDKLNIIPISLLSSQFQWFNKTVNIDYFKCTLYSSRVILKYIRIPDADIKPVLVHSIFKVYYLEILGLNVIILLLLICIFTIIVLSKRSKRNLECDQCDTDENIQSDGLIAQLDRRQANDKDSDRLIEETAPRDAYEDPYSVPYEPNIEDLYSKPNKKKEVTYAELMHSENANIIRPVKNITDSVYAEVRSEVKDLYANVRPKEQRN